MVDTLERGAEIGVCNAHTSKMKVRSQEGNSILSSTHCILHIWQSELPAVLQPSHRDLTPLPVYVCTVCAGGSIRCDIIIQC